MFEDQGYGNAHRLEGDLATTVFGCYQGSQCLHTEQRSAFDASMP